MSMLEGGLVSAGPGFQWGFTCVLEVESTLNANVETLILVCNVFLCCRSLKGSREKLNGWTL